MRTPQKDSTRRTSHHMNILLFDGNSSRGRERSVLASQVVLQGFTFLALACVIRC
jgi:hypothetical protein